MIIGIAGQTASGKTTIAQLLEERAGAVRIKYSDLLALMAKEKGLNPTDKATLQNIFLTEREAKGEDFLSKEMEKRVASLPGKLIIIEGNRRLTDIETLRHIAAQRNEALLLLFIEAPVDVRFTRYNERLLKNGEVPITAEAFALLEANGAENELPQLRELFRREGAVIDASTQTPQEIFEQIMVLL